MIQTFKVTVVGEEVAFYVETKYRQFLIDFLDNLDCITMPVNETKIKTHIRVSQFLKSKEITPKRIPKELGGCIRCGKPRRKNGRNKLYCTACKRENREKRH